MSSVPPAGTKFVTNFDKASQELIDSSRALHDKAKVAIGKAGADLDKAGDAGVGAAVGLVGAVANAGLAAGYSVKGVAETVASTGVAAGGAATGVAGGVVWAGEELAKLGSKALNAASEAFVWLGNKMSSLIGDGKTATVKEIEGQGKGRVSEKMFGTAGQLFKMSAEGYKMAWGSYENAAINALGAGVNVLFVAGYTAEATVELVAALGRTGQAGALEVGRGAVALAAIGVQGAENGVQGARDLALLTARFTAALGRAAATPADADKVQIEIKKTADAYDAQIKDLFAKNPGLKALPAYKDYVAATAH